MRNRLILPSLTLLMTISCAGCGDSTSGVLSEDKTSGIDKLKIAPDYSLTENWLAMPTKADKAVDVIYFYPSSYVRQNDEEDVIANIDSETMHTEAQHIFQLQATVFSESSNIYAPYYRQVDAQYALTISDEDNDILLRYMASTDPATALDYYFQNLNNGRPYILAGHSQGSEILLMLLSDYMKEHPDYYKNMIAAYVLGYSVTHDYLESNKHLKFAAGESDTGVIISYNTEGLGNANAHNVVVRNGAISINPLNWKLDNTYAGVDLNKGSLQLDGTLGVGIADAQVNTTRGVIECSSVDPQIYAIPEQMADLFGPESFHGWDYGFYYGNLSENIAKRIAAFDNK
jgi:hypothetical protein